MQRFFVFIMLFLIGSLDGRAQILAVDRQAPRSFGYFLGDLLSFDIFLDVKKGYELQTSSLPQPGPITYWLDLRNVQAEGNAAFGKWHVHLVYQNFYDTLDTRQLTIPPLSLNFQSGESAAQAQITPWSFTVSPLREVQPVVDEPKDLLRPDVESALINARSIYIALCAFGLLSLLFLLAIAFDRAWWPFQRGRARPFSLAATHIRALFGRATADINGPERFRKALLILHRAIDSKSGERLFGEDITLFLARYPAYLPEAKEFARFYVSSHRAFFASDDEGALSLFPPEQLLAFSLRLSKLERSME